MMNTMKALRKNITRILAVTALTAMTACSADDAPAPPAPGCSEYPVSVTVNADKGHEARSHNTANLDQISVLAYTGTTRYMDCMVMRDGSGIWRTHDGYSSSLRTYYWPWSGLDVYAFSGNLENTDAANIYSPLGKSDMTFGERNGADGMKWGCPLTIAYTVKNGNSDNIGPRADPLFASTIGRTLHDGPVPLNFRHMLCRVSFAIVNENPTGNVTVRVSQIAIDNLAGSGVYTPAQGKTTLAGLPVSDPSYGSWAVNYDSRTNFSTYENLDFSMTDNNTGNPRALTLNGNIYEMMLMPQTIPYTNAAGAVQQPRLALNYSVIDKNGSVIHGNADGTTLWGYANVPAVTWKQNTHYVYIFHIKETILNVEILPVPFDVNPFIDGGTITPPVKD